MNNSFCNQKTVDSFSLKLWRGERMVLLGMDVDEPEEDFVGFAIEVQSPGSSGFQYLRNRIAFEYQESPSKSVNGFRNFSSMDAPFQKFRWIHFPYNPQAGSYTYRVTKRHMKPDESLYSGTSITLDIHLDPIIYDGYLDVGFTRNFASSQGYADKYGNNPDIIPDDPAEGLKFQKVSSDVYQWLGFEAYDLIFGFLKDAVSDETIELDVMAYDLNEPDIVALLEQVGDRLRIIIDDSAGHGANSAETQAAKRLMKSAGKANVVRRHFSKLQHNKVLIAKRKGEPYKVLFGSTNFSYRGLYIQANNALVFYSREAASLFGNVFDAAFKSTVKFSGQLITKEWHLLNPPDTFTAKFCFSPHSDSDLSLGPIGAAIDQATSSVFFCIAFLNQAKTGPVREAIDRLEEKSVFSYGISDQAGGLEVKKPDGSYGIVDFRYLGKYAPEPFKSEWNGGAGRHEHHKFVVVDFNLPTAKVFTGSCNMSVSGEKGNGDNLVVIEDQRVATTYAIEAVRIFDHLEFRTKMKDASKGKDTLVLKKPRGISGEAAWFEKFYGKNTQLAKDRYIFAH